MSYDEFTRNYICRLGKIKKNLLNANVLTGSTVISVDGWSEVFVDVYAAQVSFCVVSQLAPHGDANLS